MCRAVSKAYNKLLNKINFEASNYFYNLELFLHNCPYKWN